VVCIALALISSPARLSALSEVLQAESASLQAAKNEWCASLGIELIASAPLGFERNASSRICVASSREEQVVCITWH
jgi:hypothetical protein